MTSDIDKLEKKLIGLNIHSVYTLCNECHTWGVNVPLNHECGNCGSKDTTVYYDIETIKSFLAKAIETAREEEREKVRQEIIKYQNGFVMDDESGEGNYLFAPEFEVIDNLLVKLKG